MNCKECGTWNPDDKRVCWKCQAELPKPVEKKQRKPAVFLGLPVWTWVVLAIMVAMMFILPQLGIGR
jgi:hypothetical protein